MTTRQLIALAVVAVAVFVTTVLATLASRRRRRSSRDHLRVNLFANELPKGEEHRP